MNTSAIDKTLELKKDWLADEIKAMETDLRCKLQKSASRLSQELELCRTKDVSIRSALSELTFLEGYVRSLKDQMVRAEREEREIAVIERTVQVLSRS